MNNSATSAAGTVRVLWLVIAGLLLLNLALLGAFWWSRPPRHAAAPASAATFLPDTLRFSPAQRQQYDTLRLRYLQRVRPLTQACRRDYQRYFQLLDSSLTEQQLGARSRAALASKAAVDVHTLRHLQQVLALCTPVQAQRLRELLQGVPALTHPGLMAAAGHPATCPAAGIGSPASPSY